MKISSAGKRAVLLLCVLGLFGSYLYRKEENTAARQTAFQGYGEAVSYENTQTLPEESTAGTRALQITDSRLNINTAGLEALKTLPGIGNVKANAVIAYRKEHGPFSTPDKIMRVPGIGEKTYEKLKDLIRV
ncbi:MAG: helix-hairpin-helix domain-containing protein [Lachnospiraceae bacterium]|nr:helix-hairpin-helix domain-containing protein [Lachnospiraceae bacterium]